MYLADAFVQLTVHCIQGICLISSYIRIEPMILVLPVPCFTVWASGTCLKRQKISSYHFPLCVIDIEMKINRMVLACDVTHLHYELTKMPRHCVQTLLKPYRKCSHAFSESLYDCVLAETHITFEVESSEMFPEVLKLSKNKARVKMCSDSCLYLLRIWCSGYYWCPDVLPHFCILYKHVPFFYHFEINAFSLDITFWMNACVFMPCVNNSWISDPFL